MNPLFSDLTVLTYHKITRQREFGINTVTPDQFRRQMQYLYEHGYNPVTFRDLHKNHLPSQPLIITFDDGYVSVYENALPVLSKFGFPAVVFLISNYLGQENTWDANLGGVKFRHLNEKQVKQLSKEGIEIGSHGASHRALTYLEDREIESELKQSRGLMSRLSHQQVITLAYPFGLQNNRVQQIAKRSGYHFGCINLWGNSAPDNPMSIKRLPVYRTDSLEAFQRKLCTGPSKKRELMKLKLLSWSALLTPVYQKYIKKLYK